jgi:hypothetical protein
MATNQSLLKSARLFHLYSGVFIAPALFFFAFTGAVQTFSLHETTRGSSYKPPRILVELGQLHKKQTLVVPERKAPASDAKAGAPAGDAVRKPASERRDHAARDASPDTPPAGPPAAQPAPGPAPSAVQSPTAKAKNLLPMKIFFLIVAIGLFFSTLTGLYMSYKYARRSSYITLTLLAGIVIPLLLLLF